MWQVSWSWADPLHFQREVTLLDDGDTLGHTGYSTVALAPRHWQHPGTCRSCTSLAWQTERAHVVPAETDDSASFHEITSFKVRLQFIHSHFPLLLLLSVKSRPSPLSCCTALDCGSDSEGLHEKAQPAPHGFSPVTLHRPTARRRDGSDSLLTETMCPHHTPSCLLWFAVVDAFLSQASPSSPHPSLSTSPNFSIRWELTSLWTNHSPSP